jgi:hypothetical protein
VVFRDSKEPILVHFSKANLLELHGNILKTSPYAVQIELKFIGFKIMALEIPHKFTPRPHQLALLKKLEETGSKYAILLWHRRAGKDVVSWVHLIRKAAMRPGLYFYIFPTAELGRKVLWQGMDNEGRELKDLIPKEFVEKTNDQRMEMRLKNGSLISIVGALEPDRLRGPNPLGVVMSEYAWHSATIWPNIIQPMLKANGGWAIINSTPDGPNHFYDMIGRVMGNPDWVVDKITVDDTGIVSKEEVDKLVDSGETTRDKADQEYYCKFTVKASGSYFGDVIQKARNERRIGHYDHDDSQPVDTYWDLGIGDDTTVWFVQRDGSRYNVIDYYEDAGKTLRGYYDMLVSKGYRYRYHFLPHDGNKRNYGIDKVLTTQQMFDILLSEDKLKRMGSSVLCNKPSRKIHAINGLRSMFNAFHFNETTTKTGLRRLELYKRKFNAKQNTFSIDPTHDENSHAADAFLNIYLGKDCNQLTSGDWAKMPKPIVRSYKLI